MKRNDQLTVIQMIEILNNAKDSGKGDYTIGCNDEYILYNDITPEINDDDKRIDFAGGG